MGDQEDLDGQAVLFPHLPIRAVRCDPLATSADCKQVCRCTDGCDYAIKSGIDIPSMPHNEWFCAKLAERVGIATTRGKIVEVDGGTSFGSRWQSGEEAGWWISASTGKFAFSDLAPALSKILAFDLFVHNGDRHLNNFFVHMQKLGAGILAMDFGRAWMFNGFPLPSLPMDENENTITASCTLSQLFGDYIDQSQVKEVTDSLRVISDVQIKEIIEQHPKEWLSTSEKDAIVDWWRSQARLDRINQIEEGIGDGTFL